MEKDQAGNYYFERGRKGEETHTGPLKELARNHAKDAVRDEKLGLGKLIRAGGGRGEMGNKGQMGGGQGRGQP